MSLTDKQEYYEYDPGQGGKWWVKDAPKAEPWFEKELLRIGGLAPDGKPVLRVVWGATALSDITEKPQLKYKATRSYIDGYNYVKEDGSIGSTKSMNLPKDAKVPWEFHPAEKTIEIGRLRWAIEIHVTAAELRRLGRFTNRRAPDGELILRELPEDGVYDHYFWIQTARNRYRDLDMQVLEAIEAMYVYNITTSEAQKALDDIERAKNKTIIGASNAGEIWQGI